MWKKRDWNLRHRNARVENAGLENGNYAWLGGEDATVMAIMAVVTTLLAML